MAQSFPFHYRTPCISGPGLKLYLSLVLYLLFQNLHLTASAINPVLENKGFQKLQPYVKTLSASNTSLGVA